MRSRLVYVLGTVAALIVVGGLAGLWHSQHHRVATEAAQRERTVAAGPRVVVAQAKAGEPFTELVLTGESRPFFEVTLSARVNGYLTDIGIDKGDAVRQDQVLAVVQAPEVTEQYRGAVADARNKAEIARRMRILVHRKLISEQEAQQAEADSAVASARVGQLAVTRGYQVLKAPFAGTVTARFVDPGALVQGGSTPLFTLAQLHKVRIFGYVDQKYATAVGPGDPATLTLPERPRESFKAQVTRIAGALDPRTRLMLVEVDYDNRKGDIVPGSYVRMTLRVPQPVYPHVPLDAVTQQGEKLRVAVVQNGRIHYREVVVGENDGRQVEIISGIRDGETVARNLGSGLIDGSRVQVAQPRLAH